MVEALDVTTAPALDRGTAAIDAGELVVYPTETVYGLGADALDPSAIERVFDAKGRAREEPVSLAVPSLDAALGYVRADPLEQEFMSAFLPGPVTVVLAKRPLVPEVLTAGRDRVGIRVPDHERVRSLLERTGPITATSANVSGQPSVTRPADLDPQIRREASLVLDGGETPGTASTVVAVAEGTIHRRGRDAPAIESWLAERL